MISPNDIAMPPLFCYHPGDENFVYWGYCGPPGTRRG